MLQKNVVLLTAVLVALIVGILIGMGVYRYAFTSDSSQNQTQNNEDTENKAAEDAAKKAGLEKLMDERYPDFIQGTLNFSDQKVTIRTEDGEEYWIWPVMQQSYYEGKGLKNGQSIEIQGYIMPKNDKIKEDRIMIRPLDTLF